MTKAAYRCLPFTPSGSERQPEASSPDCVESIVLACEDYLKAHCAETDGGLKCTVEPQPLLVMALQARLASYFQFASMPCGWVCPHIPSI